MTAKPRMIRVSITDLDGLVLDTQEIEVPEGVRYFGLVPYAIGEVVLQSIADFAIGVPEGE